MYTQAMDVPDPTRSVAPPRLLEPDDRTAQFEAAIAADGRVEPRDWMPDA